MRFIHTSDWHLGMRLYEMDRKEEHLHFLNWLLNQVQALQADVLLITGDIFDAYNPPQDALQMYYEFLSRTAKIPSCKSVIIIGGNHDSASLLNAPKEILKALNIHVVGCTTGNLQDEIIPIYSTSKDAPEAIVCAVPFLRDRDLRYFVAGETYEAKEQRLKEAIIAHYQKLHEYIQSLPHIPPIIIATGHLFAVGSQTSESEKMIHLGNLGQVEAQFPSGFKYVALGHIHKPQKVANYEHIRYAGSPIPLSFSELGIEKQIVVIDIQPNSEPIINCIPIPTYRKLLRIRGSLDEVKKQLSTLSHSSEEPTLWVEVTVVLYEKQLQIKQQVEEVVKNKKNISVLAVKVEKQYIEQGLEEDVSISTDLKKLTPHEVFRKRCENIPPEQQEELRITFDEVLSILGEQVKSKV
ncbi:MAG: exonuclease SbcCD subunit D C-terminal domain-containing protein [Bacteroidia bacterium]|nr:exonuclease SbcCD subunit D C-terminal domain-containing protein [Bacteroidia bacterium]MDW8300922.1 exonuclease SbcCD subunit D C-terminal domain-containing protein [Bacteroidia bacterium]